MDTINAWIDNCSFAGSHLLICLDSDDPKLRQYPLYLPYFEIKEPRRMVEATERAVLQHPGYDYYGSMGDDHLCRTPGWDRILIDRIKANGGWGIAYGDDLLQHENLPTACIMSANIIDTLGHMTLPGLTHYYIDNYWKELGQATGTLLYEPSVIIEHMHYFNGKAIEDQTYRENNSSGVSEHDREVFETWKRDRLAEDAQKIKDAINKQNTAQ